MNNGNGNNCSNTSNVNGNQNTTGTINSSTTNGTTLNANNQTTPRYRIDALTTSSSSPLVTSSSISQTMDGIVDSKLRQGK